MNDSQLLERLASTDAYAPDAPLPSSARTRAAAIAEIERSTDMQTQKRPTAQAPARRTRQGWLAAAAAFIVVLIVGAAMVLLAGQADEDVIEPTTTTSVSTTITTVPPPPEPVPPIVDAWQRVGAGVMTPVVGTTDMTMAGSQLVLVGFDPGEDDRRQNGVTFASDDGVNWVRLAEDDPALNLGAVLMYAVTDGGPGLVAVGMGCADDTEACSPYATAWTSTDGTSWTRTSHDPAVFGDLATQNTGMSDVIATNAGSLVAVGWLDDWTLDESGAQQSVVTSPAAWISADGVTWDWTWIGDGFELTVDAWNNVLTPPMHSVAQSPEGGLVAVGAMLDEAAEPTAAVWTSQDGTTWERIDPTLPAFGQRTVMTDITWGSNGYVAVGTEDDATPAIWTSPDGHSWARVDVSDQPFEVIRSLGSVAALESGYITVGPSQRYGDLAGGVTVWTSPNGTTWDRVHTVGGEGYASAVVVADGGIAVAGSIPGFDNVHAAVWVGPLFDPEAPPPDPGPPPLSITGDSPPLEPTVVDPSDVVSGDDGQPPSEGDYATIETGEPRLALGQANTLSDSVRLDFLAGTCDDTTCYRDATFIHPDDSQLGSSYWIENTPFHVRHGFVNESETPLGDEFDVVLFITRREGPESGDGSFDLGQPYRFDTDYVLRGTAAKCGPGYWEQTEPQTCEWFVHEFAEGIPAGRYDFWTGWYAPCSAWLNFGLVESCANPDEVTWEFYSSVNSPIFGEDYTEGWFPGPFEPETLLSSPDNREYWAPVMRGWPSD